MGERQTYVPLSEKERQKLAKQAKFEKRVKEQMELCFRAVTPVLERARRGNSRELSMALSDASKIAREMGVPELASLFERDSLGYHLKAIEEEV